MRNVFTHILFFVVIALEAQAQHAHHYHPHGFIERHHYNNSQNNCKSMWAYKHRGKKHIHVPHVVFIVHKTHVDPAHPHAHAPSASHDSAHVAALQTPAHVPTPDTVKPVPPIPEPPKVKLGPKTAKYEEQINSMASGGSLALPSINFVYNQDELAVANMESFMEAVELGQRGFMILVEGHTDERGSDDYNLKLSMKRVERIKTLMIQMGVPEDLISVVGHGERQPIVPNDSEEHRLMNRRIEFKIFKP